MIPALAITTVMRMTISPVPICWKNGLSLSHSAKAMMPSRMANMERVPWKMIGRR